MISLSEVASTFRSTDVAYVFGASCVFWAVWWFIGSRILRRQWSTDSSSTRWTTLTSATQTFMLLALVAWGYWTVSHP